MTAYTLLAYRRTVKIKQQTCEIILRNRMSHRVNVALLNTEVFGQFSLTC